MKYGQSDGYPKEYVFLKQQTSKSSSVFGTAHISEPYLNTVITVASSILFLVWRHIFLLFFQIFKFSQKHPGHCLFFFNIFIASTTFTNNKLTWTSLDHLQYNGFPISNLFISISTPISNLIILLSTSLFHIYLNFTQHSLFLCHLTVYILSIGSGDTKIFKCRFSGITRKTGKRRKRG